MGQRCDNLPAKTKSIARLAQPLLLLGGILLIATLHPQISGDGSTRYSYVEAIFNHRAVPAIKYSLVQPLLSLPIALAAKAMGFNPQGATAYFNLIVFLILGLAIHRKLRERFDQEIVYGFWIVVLSASMLPHHLAQYYGEVFSALAIVAGALLLERSRVAAPILMAVGVANTPALAVPLLVAAVLSSEYRKRLLVAVAMTVAIGAAETAVKFGSLGVNPYLSGGEKGFQTFLPYSGLPGFSSVTRVSGSSACAGRVGATGGGAIPPACGRRLIPDDGAAGRTVGVIVGFV